jgi:hypothetical protein
MKICIKVFILKRNFQGFGVWLYLVSFFGGRGALFTVFSILACVALTGRMIGDRWIGSDLEGSSRGLI